MTSTCQSNTYSTVAVGLRGVAGVDPIVERTNLRRGMAQYPMTRATLIWLVQVTVQKVSVERLTQRAAKPTFAVHAPRFFRKEGLVLGLINSLTQQLQNMGPTIYLRRIAFTKSKLKYMLEVPLLLELMLFLYSITKEVSSRKVDFLI